MWSAGTAIWTGIGEALPDCEPVGRLERERKREKKNVHEIFCFVKLLLVSSIIFLCLNFFLVNNKIRKQNISDRHLRRPGRTFRRNRRQRNAGAIRRWPRWHQIEVNCAARELHPIENKNNNHATVHIHQKWHSYPPTPITYRKQVVCQYIDCDDDSIVDVIESIWSQGIYSVQYIWIERGYGKRGIEPSSRFSSHSLTIATRLSGSPYYYYYYFGPGELLAGPCRDGWHRVGSNHIIMGMNEQNGSGWIGFHDDGRKERYVTRRDPIFFHN